MLKLGRNSPIATGFLIGALLLIAAFMFVPRDTVIEPLHAVSDPAATALLMISEISKLVMTLNAAMLAAAGALIFKGYSWVRLGGLDKALLVFVFLASATSYFGVYFSQVRLLTMVSTGYLDPLEHGLIWGLRLQYGGLVAGVFLLGLVLARALDHDGRSRRVQVPEPDLAPALS